MENFCCIENDEIINNSQFKNSLNNGVYENEESIMGTSLLKTLPTSDLIVTTSRNDKKTKVSSLSRIPISTNNVIRKQSGNPFENYKLLKKLGQGTFGQVYKIMHKTTGNIRAMKIIPKNNLRPGFTDKDIIQEITIMKKLDHPHVIKLFEFYIDDSNYYLINEFCTEGDLSEKMYKLKALPEQIVKIIMAQIFNAVLYLNNRGIIHGDLKLENILVDSYLDDGNNRNEGKEESNFISSLMEDAKNIQKYLANVQLKRSCTSLNLKNKCKLSISIKEDKDDNSDKKHKKRNTLEFDMNKNKIKKGKTNIIKDENDIIYENEEFNSTNKDTVETKNSKDISILNNNENNFHTPKKNNDNSNNITPIKKTIKKVNFALNPKIVNKEIKANLKRNQSARKMRVKIKRKSTYNYNELKIKNFELKLIDFGCSKIFTQYKRNFEDTIGTLVYCSPEVLKNNYNQKCDIWACGVIMYILLSGKYPFYGQSEEEITKKILLGNYDFNDKHFKNVSAVAKDLIKKCLIHDKDKRISVKEAIRHEFFAGEININNLFEDDIDTKNILSKLKNNSKKISKFYQIVLAYLAYNFADKEEIKRIRKIFYKIDLNLDGKLSKEELFIAYKEAGIELSQKELKKIIIFFLSNNIFYIFITINIIITIII